MVYTPDIVSVLNGNALPHIAWPRQRRSQTFETKGSLREYLKDMAIGLGHHIESLLDEVVGNRFVKQVTHAIHENHSWFFPLQRQQELIRVQCNVKAVAVTWVPHCLKSHCQPFGITILASWTYFGATSHGIPGCISPLYC